jgi:oxygen-dependent protoporphyrinogen oxidase
VTEHVAGIADAAARSRVVVVGGGASGLVAAMECAKVGIAVTVLEASSHTGGVLRTRDVAGLPLDVGAESFATRGGHVRQLIDDLGLSGEVVDPRPGGAWIAGIPEVGAAPIPKGGLLGIPANPWDESVRRVIGWGGAWRAYLDRLRPPLTIGHDRSLGHLVRTRMGAKVLDRLVAPVTSGVYSSHPDDIDVDLAAPGLNTALTRTGSLSGAVAELVGGRTTSPGAAVGGLVGGMGRLADALVARLRELGVEVRTDATVASIEHGESADTFRVVVDGDDAETLAADAVILAVGEHEARRLAAPLVSTLAPETPGAAPVVEVITLVVDAPALDAAPRGTGVLTVPGSHAAKALTHSTAKWPWVADAAGPGVHVIRLSFGAQDEAPATESLSDEDAAALALSEASALLGVPLTPDVLRGSDRQRYVQAQPGSVLGRPERVAAARAAIQAVPRLGVVGAWVAGTGLAQVVPDAKAEADRVRRQVLWGPTGEPPATP